MRVATLNMTRTHTTIIHCKCSVLYWRRIAVNTVRSQSSIIFILHWFPKLDWCRKETVTNWRVQRPDCKTGGCHKMRKYLALERDVWWEQNRWFPFLIGPYYALPKFSRNYDIDSKSEDTSLWRTRWMWFVAGSVIGWLAIRHMWRQFFSKRSRWIDEMFWIKFRRGKILT